MGFTMKRKIKWKVVVAAGAAVIAVGVIANVVFRYFRYDAYKQYLSSYEVESGSEFQAAKDDKPSVPGMVLVAENDTLKLYTNTETTEIAVYEKESGNITYSNPVERDSDAICAALLGCLLAACNGSADSSPASSAAPASDSASASGSSELPSSTTEANTGELNPGNFDENSVFSITGTENAFAPCLGWGPGVSGCSLKSVIAAASLLHWAEDARMSSRSPEAIQEAFYSWYDGLTDNQQEGFAEAWPLIKDAALDLLSDKDSMTGRIADAGLDADTLPGCTLKNWQALQSVLDGIVPETNGEA